mgnify:CR=1 FL=1
MRSSTVGAFVCALMWSALTVPAWAGDWVELSPGTRPSPRGTEMVYDAARDRVVLFGGSIGNHVVPGNLLGDTWEWDGSNWQQMSPATSPSPRTWHAMAYDERRQVVVLFGGATPAENNETWEWNGSNWTRRTPATSPSIRRGAAMAYDRVTQTIILFGGYADYLPFPGALAETWSWDGTNWSQLSPSTSPPPAEDHCMATSPDGTGVVHYGGSPGRGSPSFPLTKTWKWNGSTWTDVTPALSPPGRYGHGLAATGDGTLMTFGGSYDLATRLNHGDTWEWNGTSWQQQFVSGPVRRGGQGMAYDSMRNRTILFGGGANPAPGVVFLYNDTWAYLPSAPPAGGLQVHYEFEETSGPVLDSAGTRHGTSVGATRGVAGIRGRAVQLDGIGNHITIPYGNGVTYPLGITIQAWVLSTDWDASALVTARGPGSGASSNFLGLNVGPAGSGPPHNPTMNLYVGNPGTAAAVMSPTLINDGRWHHVLGVYDGALLSIYVDGALMSISATPLAHSSADFKIGWDDFLNRTDRRFAGSVDEVKIWNRGFTPAEALAAYREYVNQSPTANAGADLMAECAGPVGTQLTLDGTGSSDPDGDALTYLWSTLPGSGITFDDATLARPTAVFPLGTTRVTLTVSDPSGATSTDEMLVTIVDTPAPVVVCSTDVTELWPANHKMVRVTAAVRVTDHCIAPGSLPLQLALRSSEPDDARGDSRTRGDTNGSDGYSATVWVNLTWDTQRGAYVGTFELRAERDGAGTGRTYTLTATAADPSGNAGTGSSVVVVPHDRRSAGR